MTNWHTDDEYLSGPAATSLPTPADTPYRTPSRTSRMTRRSVTPPPKGPTPPPGERERQERAAKRSSRDITKDETISPLDPRRFTPTLHANLVSEILTLRRDQEDKTKIIESLESALTTSREDQESLRENLSITAKENRSIKRQLSLLEGGTSSALGELARERDEAVEQAVDVKKRLETAQKKLRIQDDDSERVHDLWAKEKDAWEDERRKFERKIHIAESRLKSVLDEVAAFQAAQAGVQHGHAQGHESDPESTRDTDAGSVRSMSMTANSVRYSVNFTDNRLNGNTLADELDFDGDDGYDTDIDGRESVLSRRTSLRHTRNFSRDSVINRFHRRNQSIDSLNHRGSLRGRMLANHSLFETAEGDEDARTEIPSVEYTDTGVQYTPPSSPEPPPTAVPSTPELAPSQIVTPDGETTRKEGEYEANQRRKRVQATKPAAEEPSEEPQVPAILMVSVASQTIEEPISPPKTPPPEAVPPEMVTSFTQTEESAAPVFPPLPPPIPSISIQPPTSRPTTPREPRLPPNFKHFGCQVNISSTTSSSDASIQTEGIQVDKRIAQLPRHLQPSSVTSRPNSPVPAPINNLDKDFNLPSAPVLPNKSPRRFAQQPANSYMPPSPVTARAPVDTDELHLHDAYPGNNDDGPLSARKDAPIKRPQRFSSLFAGFDTASSDEGDEFGVEASDSEYQTPLSARPQSISDHFKKRSSSSTGAMSPEPPEQTIKQGPARSLAKPLGTETYSSFSLVEEEPESPRTVGTMSPKPHEISSPGSERKPSAIRKTALIQSGIATHSGRPRSPSLPEGPNPPFPIPTRASSRRPPASSSAPSDGLASPTRMDHWPSRGPRNAYRTNSIRKVRSAAALARREHSRQRSLSPPPMSPSSGVPESPAYPPPLPRNDITTPRGRRGNHYKRHRHRPSTNTERTDPTSVNSHNQTAGVVDAIAQTMVGEWMFKYVRRRKSFTVSESNGKDDTGNERHKRWVWLAPYERAILWSSKQPNSGSALMGKAGRKLTIQSVLDVKDDNPTPKGATSVFDRSILILTSQRALKFTASNSERHYIWLTALSFLAHSQQAIPEILSPAAPSSKMQSTPEQVPPQKARGRRPGIRDSIRLAKGRNPAGAKAGTPSIPSIPSAPSSHVGEVASFTIPETIGAISSSHTRDESEDIAIPPMIPRFNERNDRNAVHGRKRSNTGGHVPPPLSFRGFSNPPSHHRGAGSTADASIITAGSSEYYQSQASGGSNWGGVSQWSASQPSYRPSEASSRPSNFFDAIGTVRMEAFISPLSDYPAESQEYGYVARRRSKDARRRRSRSRQRDSYSYRSRASEDRYGGNRTAGEEDFFRDDPFRGF